MYMMNMNSIFLLKDGERIAFLFHHMMQTFGSTYISLWSFLPPPSNYLASVEGIYNGENIVAHRLFDEYRQTLPQLLYHEGRIPGMAFKNNVPYLEVMFPDLERLASNEVQKQFYMPNRKMGFSFLFIFDIWMMQEAGIKTAIFMGCDAGEIEVGWCSVPQANMEMEMKTLFPEDFSRQAAATSSLLGRWLSTSPLQPDPKLPSSSSSSLRSLSMDSPESLLFNVAAATSYPSQPPPPTEPFADQTAVRIPPPSAIQTLGQIDFQSMQGEEAAIARAFLAVISSSSSSASSFQPGEENFSEHFPKSSPAFRKYGGGARPSIATIKKQSVLKRSIAFYRNLNSLRRQGLIRPASRHTTTQVHHMISERKRREKLNESFQQLRSLLPHGTKKDKASVLSATTEQLTSLISQVEELRRRNQTLEAESSRTASTKVETEVAVASSSASSSPTVAGKVDVRLKIAGEAAEDSNRVVEVQVRVGEESGVLELLVVRLMEFLREVENVGVVSLQANTTRSATSSVQLIIFTLAIQGGEFDESSFVEAVRRVAADFFE